MLVLTRKKGESIIIDVPPSDQPQRIAITFLDFNSHQIRLGTQADKKVVVARSELVANWRKPGTSEDNQD